MNAIKQFVFTAIFIATALTISCSSDDDDNGKEDNPSSSSVEATQSSSDVGTQGSSSSGGTQSSSDMATQSSSSVATTQSSSDVGTQSSSSSVATSSVCSIEGYKIVTIGTQIWMAENLNCEVEGSKCYDDDPDNCDTYGRLYDWETANEVCPDGWHLPSRNEWGTLMQVANPSCSLTGNCSEAGVKLKAINGWDDTEFGYIEGTDEYDFSALSGGLFDEDEMHPFGDIGKTGYWWSATTNNSGSCAYTRRIENSRTDVLEQCGGGNFDNMYSVRCVKNN